MFVPENETAEKRVSELRTRDVWVRAFGKWGTVGFDRLRVERVRPFSGFGNTWAVVDTVDLESPHNRPSHVIEWSAVVEVETDQSG